MKTPAGLVSLFLIVWHFFGSMVAHVVIGVIFFATVLSVWFWVWKRTYVRESKVTVGPGLPFFRTKTKEVTSDNVNAEFIGVMMFAFAVITVVSGMTIFTW
tara:strand:+ start:1460 stop:1762 length:303 start_codon:yes stop_codon:yes gene_type:complete